LEPIIIDIGNCNIPTPSGVTYPGAESSVSGAEETSNFAGGLRIQYNILLSVIVQVTQIHKNGTCSGSSVADA